MATETTASTTRLAAGPGDGRPLIIGVGNRDRGDDGVGLLVVDAIAHAHHGEVETFAAEGDLSDLALRWHPDQRVVVVDAVGTVGTRQPEAGRVMEIDGLDHELAAAPSLLSSHGVGVVEAIELGRLLGRAPLSITIIGIEGATFDHFAPMSEDVLNAVPTAVRMIEEAFGLRASGLS